MSNPKGPNKTGRTGRWPIPPATPEAKKLSRAGGERPAGRVVHDARGNAVWNWSGDTSRIAVDSTSAMLKRLDVPDLKVAGQEETPVRAPTKAKTKDAPPPEAGGGYNPYDQRKAVRKPTTPKGPVCRRGR